MWDGDDFVFRVTRSVSGDYSIWPAELGLPRGWFPEDVVGSKDECLLFIKDTWTGLAAAQPPSSNLV